jgi:hypothetical protein
MATELTEAELLKLYGAPSAKPANEPSWFMPGSKSESAATSFADAATLHSGKYVTAAWNAFNTGVPYSKALENENKQIEASRKANPGISTLGSLVGGAPAALATGGESILATGAKNAVLGGVTGGAETGTVGGAAEGAGISGVLGSIGHGIGQGVSTARDYIGRKSLATAIENPKLGEQLLSNIGSNPTGRGYNQQRRLASTGPVSEKARSDMTDMLRNKATYIDNLTKDRAVGGAGMSVPEAESMYKNALSMPDFRAVAGAAQKSQPGFVQSMWQGIQPVLTNPTMWAGKIAGMGGSAGHVNPLVSAGMSVAPEAVVGAYRGGKQIVQKNAINSVINPYQSSQSVTGPVVAYAGDRLRALGNDLSQQSGPIQTDQPIDPNNMTEAQLLKLYSQP